MPNTPTSMPNTPTPLTTPERSWEEGGYVGRVRARGGMRPRSHDVATLTALLAGIAVLVWCAWEAANV